MTIHRALGYVDRASLADGAPLRVVMATEGRKGDGIDLRMSGARLERFRSNPILGYGHSYWGRGNLPIGRVDPDSIEVVGTTLAGELDFDAADEFAVTVERKMRDGFLSAVSIGFDVLEWEDGKGDLWRGGVATSWEMHELSVVPVPMDDKALVASGRSLLDAPDRTFLRVLADEFGADVVLAAIAGTRLAPDRPAPPVQNPTPPARAEVDPDAARALLAAFAKES